MAEIITSRANFRTRDGFMEVDLYLHDDMIPTAGIYHFVIMSHLQVGDRYVEGCISECPSVQDTTLALNIQGDDERAFFAVIFGFFRSNDPEQGPRTGFIFENTCNSTAPGQPFNRNQLPDNSFLEHKKANGRFPGQRWYKIMIERWSAFDGIFDFFEYSSYQRQSTQDSWELIGTRQLNMNIPENSISCISHNSYIGLAGISPVGGTHIDWDRVIVDW